MSGRSSVERMPPEVLAIVHEAIHEGATIDETVRRMRAHGGTCSRSAVTRYVRQARDVLRRRSEAEGLAGLWLGTLGDRPEGRTGRLAIETLRTLAMRAAMALDDEEEPPDIDKVGALALAIGRIENAGKVGAARETATARDAGPKAVWPPDPAQKKKGLSPETVAHIRAAVQGYWGPGTSGADEEAAVQAYWDKRTPETHEE